MLDPAWVGIALQLAAVVVGCLGIAALAFLSWDRLR